MTNLALVNPRRKKRSTRKTTKRRVVRRNPKSTSRRISTRRTKRRVRSNPKLLGGVSNQLMDAGIGAGGALALDVAFGALPVPPIFKAGALGSVAKIGGAVALGRVAKMFVGKKRSEQMIAGAITVLAYDMMKKFVSTNIPAIPLSEYVGIGTSVPLTYYNGENQGLGYMGAGMAAGTPAHGVGEYVGTGYEMPYDPSDGMGEMSYY